MATGTNTYLHFVDIAVYGYDQAAPADEDSQPYIMNQHLTGIQGNGANLARIKNDDFGDFNDRDNIREDEQIDPNKQKRTTQ